MSSSHNSFFPPVTESDSKASPSEIAKVFIDGYAKPKIDYIEAMYNYHQPMIIDCSKKLQDVINWNHDPKGKEFLGLCSQVLAYATAINADTKSEDSIGQYILDFAKKTDEYIATLGQMENEWYAKTQDGSMTDEERKERRVLQQATMEGHESYVNTIWTHVVRKTADRKSEIYVEALQRYKDILGSEMVEKPEIEKMGAGLR